MPTKSHGKLFPRIPLRLVLIVPFVIQVALFVGLVGYLSFRNGQQAVNDVTRQLRSELVARIEEHLRAFLATPHHINQINANAVRQGLPDASDLNALERYLWQQIQVFDSVTSVYFGNTEGGLVDAGREGAEGSLYVIVTDEFKSGPFRKYATDSAGNRAELLSTVPDFDARTRSWYSGAIEKGGATWSDVYILFTGQDMAIAASRPVYDEQQNLLGVVSSDIFVSHISDFLRNLEIGKTGSSFIVERSGSLVASSTEERPFTDPDGDEAPRRLYASESAVPTIRYAAEFLTGQFGDYHNITGAQHFEFQIDGQRQFLQVSTIRDEYGIDWLVVVVIPESDFMEQINAGNRTTVFLVGIALLLTVVAGVVTAQWITGPISRLNTSTQALAKGEWDQRVSEEWISEIGELARSFNDMAGHLKRTLESLTSEIAERRRTEKALRESEERLGLALKGAELGTWDWNVPTGEVFFNERWAEMLGYTLDEIEPHIDFWEKRVHPDDISEVMQVLTAHLEGRTPIYQTEHRLCTKSGEWGWILDTGKVFERDEQGDPVRAVGIHQDITERKRAEDALQLFKAVVESSAEAIVISNPAGELIYINPAHEKLFGRPLEEARRMNYRDYYPDESAEVLNRVVAPTLARGEDWEGELDVFDGTGRRFPLWERAGTVRDANGDMLYGFSFMHDITERKQAEEALRQSKRRLEETLAELRETQEQMMHQERLAAVGQLAAGIAHDFNNILASITLYTQMSLRANELSPTIRKRLEVIAEQADRAADLVQQILDFGRRAMIERRPLAMDSFLEEVAKLLERTLPESVQMELVVEPGDYIVNADPTRIQQAIVNLALNARDAMPEGGELRVALSRVEGKEINCVDCGRVVGGEWVQVEVRDSGAGIPPDVLPHIFEPFFTTRAPLGHGLGLAQVYGIVKQHEGHLEMETEVGRGTTFRLYWPALLLSEPEPQAPRQLSAAQGEGQTILVVEDNATMRAALVDVLEMLGYRALAAANGREALDIFERRRDEIALVLSDWVMPVMGGLELVRELEARQTAVKVVMLTGHLLDEGTKRAVPGSVVGWVLKPPSLEQLAEAVAQALGEES